MAKVSSAGGCLLMKSSDDPEHDKVGIQLRNMNGVLSNNNQDHNSAVSMENA